MHGAGMAHSMLMAATDECGGGTAVIELFPLGQHQQGIRNMNVLVSALLHIAGREFLHLGMWHDIESL